MTTPDDALVLTPNGIPVSLRPYLQEYTLEKLRVEDSADILVERTLRYGTRQELRWLFRQYGRRRITEWVREYGSSFLDPIDFTYWRVVLEIEEYRTRSSRSVWKQRWDYIGK